MILFQGLETHEHKLQVLFLTKAERDEQDFTPKSDTHNIFFFKGQRQVNDYFICFLKVTDIKTIFISISYKTYSIIFSQMPDVNE